MTESTTKLQLDIGQNKLNVEGNESFVKQIYEDFKKNFGTNKLRLAGQTVETRGRSEDAPEQPQALAGLQDAATECQDVVPGDIDMNALVAFTEQHESLVTKGGIDCVLAIFTFLSVSWNTDSISKNEMKKTLKEIGHSQKWKKFDKAVSNAVSGRKSYLTRNKTSRKYMLTSLGRQKSAKFAIINSENSK